MFRIILTIALFFFTYSVNAQISTPEKRNYNIGFYGGLSVVNYKPMVALDLSYKGTTLRVMPNYSYIGLGLTQEIMQISKVFYNLYWTASFYGGVRTDEVTFAASPASNYSKTTYSGVLSTGVKTYFAKRMYTHIMGGVMYSVPQGGDGSIDVHKPTYVPYFEFGLGMHIFKNYPILKREETAE